MPSWPAEPKPAEQAKAGGAGGIRTPDLLDAIEARCQLRYGPTGGLSAYLQRIQPTFYSICRTGRQIEARFYCKQNEYERKWGVV